MTRLLSSEELKRATVSFPTTFAIPNQRPRRPPTPAKLRRLCESALAACNILEVFDTIKDVEHMDIEELRAMRHGRTIFALLARTIAENGVDPGTTIGSVMDILELDRDNVHTISCHCHEHEAIMSAPRALEGLCIVIARKKIARKLAHRFLR